jgi:hypothetical protein
MSFATLGLQSAGSMTMGLQGLGTGFNIFGALQSGKSQATSALIQTEASARASEARADADRFNAKVADQMAVSAEQQATATAADYRRIQGSKLASRRAVAAASGVALEGSPLMIDNSIFQQIEFGASRISYAGSVQATRARNQGTLLRVSAENTDRSADFARQAGQISADNIMDASYIKAIGAGITGLGELSKTMDKMGTLSTSGGGGWESSNTSPASWEDDWVWKPGDQGYW